MAKPAIDERRSRVGVEWKFRQELRRKRGEVVWKRSGRVAKTLKSQINNKHPHQCEDVVILIKLHFPLISYRQIGHLLKELAEFFLFLFRKPAFLRID